MFFKRKKIFSLILLLAFFSVLFNVQTAIANASQKALKLPKQAKESYVYLDKVFNPLEEISIKEVHVPKIYRNGVLFTFLGDKNTKKVLVAGEFSNWKKHYALTKTDFNLFYRFVPLKIDKGIYQYKFVIDNIWLNDPLQPYKQEDYYGQKITSVYIPIDLNIYTTSPQYLGEDVYFFFLRDEGYNQVNWIGSDNKWDTSLNPMDLVSGYWSIEKKINPQKRFYKFMVDGEDTLDPNNPEQSIRQSKYIVNVIPTIKKKK